MLRRWENLPDFMRIPEVKPYYDILAKKRCQIFVKQVFDVFTAILTLVVLAIPMLIISCAIKLTSKGNVFFRQERVTTYGRHFYIYKFRTMVQDAEKLGSVVTVNNDSRITPIGAFLRKYRLDEFPQLFNVITGDMSFVGTRPEVPKYVEKYTNEMRATLLLPAGITSEASIRYKDEDALLSSSDDVDRIYAEEVLPAKMKWNLESIVRFRFLRELLTMIRTVLAVCGVKYE